MSTPQSTYYVVRTYVPQGQFTALSIDERKALVEAWVGAASHGELVVAHVVIMRGRVMMKYIIPGSPARAPRSPRRLRPRGGGARPPRYSSKTTTDASAV